MITRTEALRRARTIWPMGGVPYSQSSYYNGYRQDCSGFVSGAWKLPVSYNTETFVTQGIMYEIQPADMKPGDAIGLCGPGTGGNAGHIQFVVEPLAGRDNRIIEQAGGRPGPTERVAYRPSNYRVFRCIRVADSLPTISIGANDHGNTNGPVYLAQRRLNAFGAGLVVDGDFGTHTDGAVQAFQDGHHIVRDGVIGPVTWSYL